MEGHNQIGVKVGRQGRHRETKTIGDGKVGADGKDSEEKERSEDGEEDEALQFVGEKCPDVQLMYVGTHER